MISLNCLTVLFFALFAFVVSMLIYRSEKRAPTEARKYVYSPTYAPRTRTPKRTFAILALTMGGGCLALAFFAFLHPTDPFGPNLIPPEQKSLLNMVADVLLWVSCAACAASAGLIILTTRPLDPISSHEDDEQPHSASTDDVHA